MLGRRFLKAQSKLENAGFEELNFMPYPYDKGLDPYSCRARRQKPRAGSRVDAGRTIHVRLRCTRKEYEDSEDGGSYSPPNLYYPEGGDDGSDDDDFDFRRRRRNRVPGIPGL